MAISLEQIDLVMQRSHASYAQAKEALEHCNGDVVEALLFLEKVDTVNTSKSSSWTDKINGFINEMNATAFIMKKNDITYVDVPLSAALITIIVCFHFSVIALIVALICGVRISILHENERSPKAVDPANDEFLKK